MTDNTIFLRLAGPMQSWGTSSRFQLRRTDMYPSKSGVLGLLLCAMGISREEATEALKPLVLLSMGIRIDRAGVLDWDYHTVGAKIGTWQADRKKLKRTAATGEYETLLSRRQYLWDASFLVAFQGDSETILTCANALRDPVWPVFLGRKCCIPAEPVFAGTGMFDSLSEALSSTPWRPRNSTIDLNERTQYRTVDTILEHPPGSSPPEGAKLVHDVPRTFGFYSHGPRWIVADKVTVPVQEALRKIAPDTKQWRDPYGSEWKAMREIRLEHDNYLCVFCKLPAVDVHHLDYDDIRPETLRSLCRICHSACTMLEYGKDMYQRRIDPSNPEQRSLILRQIKQLLAERRFRRHRKLLEDGRRFVGNYIDKLPSSWVKEDN